MCVLDIILIIPLAYLAFKGFRNGLIMEVVGLISLIAGVYIALKFSEYIAKLLDLNEALAMLIIFLAVVIGLFFIGKVLEGIIKSLSLHWLNRLAGMFLALLKTVLILGVFLNTISQYDRMQKIISPKIRQESYLMQPICKISSYIWPQLKSFITENNPINN